MIPWTLSEERDRMRRFFRRIGLTRTRAAIVMGLFVGLSVEFVICPSCAAPEAGSSKQMTVLATGSTEGLIQIFGRHHGRRGYSAMQGLRAADGPVLLIDAGNFASKPDSHWARRTEFVWELMAQAGYDVVTPGSNELDLGLGGLQQLLQLHPEIRVVSANVQDQERSPIFARSVVLERDGTRIGITGITEEIYHRDDVEQGYTGGDQFSFQNPREALFEVVPKLRQSADVVVVLAHTGPTQARRLAEGVPGIDVLVVGHGSSFGNERVANTMVLRPGNPSIYVHVADVSIDDRGQVAVSTHVLRMIEEYPSGPSSRAP